MPVGHLDKRAAGELELLPLFFIQGIISLMRVKPKFNGVKTYEVFTCLQPAMSFTVLYR